VGKGVWEKVGAGATHRDRRGRRKLNSKVGVVAMSSYRSNSGVKRGKVGAAQVHPKMAQILYPQSRSVGHRKI
jgi:hypothetical protein